MRFESPWWLLGLLLLPVVAWLRRRWTREATFVYSSVGLVKGITSLSRSRAGMVLRGLRWVSMALVFVALARPQSGGSGKPFLAGRPARAGGCESR